MKHFYTKVLIILVALFACENLSAIEYQTISFLAKEPSVNEECTNESILDYVEESKVKDREFISSIDCHNVFMKAKDNQYLTCGVWLESTANPYEESSITLNFNYKKIITPVNIAIIGCPNKIPEGDCYRLKINDREITMKGYDQELQQIKNDNQFYQYSVNIFSTGTSNTLLNNYSHTTNKISDPEPMKKLEIILPPLNGKDCGFQLMGLRFFYNIPLQDLSDVETVVEDLEAEQGIKVYEYYDLMGRRLAEAPQRGVYVRKCGGKVEKLIANGR